MFTILRTTCAIYHATRAGLTWLWARFSVQITLIGMALYLYAFTKAWVWAFNAVFA